MYSNILNRIVVWKTKDNYYYYRIYKHYFVRYYVGYYNSYGHEVVLIIDDLQEKKIRSKKKNLLSQKTKQKLINYINSM